MDLLKKRNSKLAGVLFYIAGFVAVIILSQLLIGMPLLNSANNLKKEFKLRQARLQEQEFLIRDIPNPQKSIKEIERKAAEFQDLEVTKKQLPRLISLLGRSISEYNINLVSIRPREDVKVASENLPTGVTKIYIELVLNCPYRIFGDYLASLNKLPVVFIVENISVDKKEGQAMPAGQPKNPLSKDEEKIEDLNITLLVSTYMVLEI